MEVVTCYKAAQIAKVSKQAIQNLKILNASGKKKYSFFKYNKMTGEIGVDVNDREWTIYVNKTVNTRTSVSKEIEPVIDMESGIVQGEQDNNALLMNMITAVEKSVIEVLNPKPEKLKELQKKIIENYRGLNV